MLNADIPCAPLKSTGQLRERTWWSLTDLGDEDGVCPDVRGGRVAAGERRLGSEPAQRNQSPGQLAVVAGVDAAGGRHARQLDGQRATDEEVARGDVHVDQVTGGQVRQRQRRLVADRQSLNGRQRHRATAQQPL